MLGVLSIFLFAVDMTGTMALIAMLAALVVFVIGLLMGKDDEEDLPVEKLPKKTCPVCNKSHDFDYPKCPFCGHEYQ